MSCFVNSPALGLAGSIEDGGDRGWAVSKAPPGQVSGRVPLLGKDSVVCAAVCQHVWLERSILHNIPNMRNLRSCICMHLPAVQRAKVHLDQRVACHVHFGSQSFISFDPGIQCQSFVSICNLTTCITCRLCDHVWLM